MRAALTVLRRPVEPQSAHHRVKRACRGQVNPSQTLSSALTESRGPIEPNLAGVAQAMAYSRCTRLTCQACCFALPGIDGCPFPSQLIILGLLYQVTLPLSHIHAMICQLPAGQHPSVSNLDCKEAQTWPCRRKFDLFGGPGSTKPRRTLLLVQVAIHGFCHLSSGPMVRVEQQNGTMVLPCRDIPPSMPSLMNCMHAS